MSVPMATPPKKKSVSGWIWIILGIAIIVVDLIVLVTTGYLYWYWPILGIVLIVFGIRALAGKNVSKSTPPAAFTAPAASPFDPAAPAPLTQLPSQYPGYQPTPQYPTTPAISDQGGYVSQQPQQPPAAP